MNRRGFLGAILAAGVAPGLMLHARAMPVRVLEAPRIFIAGDFATEPPLQPVAFFACSLEEYARQVERLLREQPRLVDIVGRGGLWVKRDGDMLVVRAG